VKVSREQRIFELEVAGVWLRIGQTPPIDRVVLKGIRHLSQLAIQEFTRPAVGKVSRGGVVVLSVMAGESVTLRRRWFLPPWFLSNGASLRGEVVAMVQTAEPGHRNHQSSLRLV
jgi:hypothetical protein